MRKNISEEERKYNRHLYGGWDPHENDYVWVENGALEELERELKYYEKHPTIASPEELTKLLNKIIKAWDNDRKDYGRYIQRILEEYDNLVEKMKEREAVYSQLKESINHLRSQLNEMEETQRELDVKIEEIKQNRKLNRELALRYRNEAVDAYNNVADDRYCIKFERAKIEKLRQLLNDMGEKPLAYEAQQALAIQVLTDVQAIQKNVTRKKAEFLTALLLVKPEAEHIIEQFEQWRDNTYFDEAKQNKVDMDYWSDDEFSQVMRNATTIYERIQKGEFMEGYEIDQLQDDFENLQKIKEQGEEIVQGVFNRCKVSEECQQLAEIAAQILYEEFHFELKALGYDGNDKRHAYVIEMENHCTNRRIRLVFSPVSQTQSVIYHQISLGDYEDEKSFENFEQQLQYQLSENGIVFSINKTNKEQNPCVVQQIEFTPKGEPICLPSELRAWETYQ